MKKFYQPTFLLGETCLEDTDDLISAQHLIELK